VTSRWPNRHDDLIVIGYLIVRSRSRLSAGGPRSPSRGRIVTTMVRGAVAGAVAAAVWVAAEPLGQRVFRTPYSDVRLLGALLTARASWRRVGIAAHLANGALFGATFERMGGGGWRQGLVAAELENLILWPAMAVVDRIHPDRRRGSWPPLVSNPRVFAYEATMHALFGVVLGLLHRAARDRNRLDAPHRMVLLSTTIE
jgi:hypothetical protein